VRFVALTLKNRAPVGAAVLVLLLGGAAGCGGGDQEVTTTPLWDVERLSFRPGRASEALGVIPAGFSSGTALRRTPLRRQNSFSLGIGRSSWRLNTGTSKRTLAVT
jgi:hypothetical protein